METPSQNVPEASEPPEKHELRREIVDFLKLVAWFLIIFLGLRAYVIEGYEVQGESMEPTLTNNERILVLKLPHELSKFSLFRGLNAVEPGDIVVFDSPDNSGKRYVKRVIAKGAQARSGQTVSAGSAHAATNPSRQVLVTYDHGDVYVNNRRVEQDYLADNARVTPERQDLALGPGDYYVLGDNRVVSKDSRSFDAIHDNAIIGTAILRFWPPSRISFLR